MGLTGGRKTVLLVPQANEDFRQFFAEQFPAEPEDSRHDATESRDDEHDETKNGQDEQD